MTDTPNNAETIDNVVLTDSKTGHKILPVTSYKSLKDLPPLLTSDDVKVADSYIGNPPQGPRVINWIVFDSKTLTVNDFKILFFNCTAKIDKGMMTAPWGDDNRLLFSFPDDFDPNNTGHYSFQEMVGRIAGVTEQLGFNFRERNHKIYFDGIQNGSGIDINSLPDQFVLELNGSFVKY